MRAQEHGDLHVLYGCRAWIRSPAAALKRNMMGTSCPMLSPSPAAAQCVAPSLPAAVCWGEQGGACGCEMKLFFRTDQNY